MYAQWNEFSVNLIYNPSVCMDFISPNRGAAGGSGMIRTVDGGDEWVQLQPPIHWIYRIQIINDSVIIGAGNSNIIKTTDFGNSWTIINPGISDQIVSLFFVNPSVGYASTLTTGYLIKTTDGGENWTQIRNYEWNLSELYFVNTLTGYAVGNSGSLKKTTDGGLNWSNLNINTSEWLQCVHFLNTDTGFVGGFNGVFMTTNAGQTWTYKGLSMITSIDFADQENGYASGYNGKIYKTTNSGLNWSNLGSLTTEEFAEISVCDSATIYALSVYGKLFKTTNAGATWINQYPNEEARNFKSVYFTNHTNGFVAGHLGNIFKTSDSGNNWYRSYSGTGKDLYSIYFIDGNVGFAVGEAGTLLKTSNNGETWSRKNLEINHNLNFISFFDGTIGISVGDSGKIFKSTNNGETWSSITNNIISNLNSVTCIDDSIGFITGDSGLLFRTADKGESWNTIDLETNLNLNTVFFVNTQIGYLAGDSGFVSKTTNGGIDWLELNSLTSKKIKSLFFVDENIGYSAGNSALRVTPNGGGFWGDQYYYEPIQFNSIFFINKDIGYSVTSDGYIFKTTNGGRYFVPVELTSFSAEALDQKVVLKWTTATELNNHGFEIQRGKSKTELATIGFVSGEGTTTNPKEYSFIDKELDDGKYYYRLKQIDYNGSFEYSNVLEIDVRSLDDFKLEQNYPNPFNPTTSIGYILKVKTNVKLVLLNSLGEEVALLVNEEKDKGFHNVTLNAESLASGIYFYRLQVGDYVETKKMILIK
jgi:photosystem II stability/assembly factor-like uncharacterized protein